MEHHCKTSKHSKKLLRFEEKADDTTKSQCIKHDTVSPADINLFLNKVSSYVSNSSDDLLKKEYKRLTELLSSYNTLTERLNKQRESPYNKDYKQFKENKKFGLSSPEIYAILRPELFKEISEEEKKHFITRFSKKRLYTNADKVLISHTLSPPYVLENRREIEKERLCKLIASAPSGFNNLFDDTSSKRSSKKLLKNSFYNVNTKVEDVREKEKDRLAKIFAGNSILISKINIQKSKENQKRAKNLELTLNDDTLKAEESMVRVGEYSPLNGHQRGKTTLGVGEHEEQRKLLEEERKREYINSMAARGHKEVSTSHSSRINNNQSSARPRMSSASTQTDSEESTTSYLDNQAEIDSPVNSASSSPSRRVPVEFSPREKLLSDLHGSVLMNRYQTALCEKEKQAAYAKALRAQIEEKKRLEEERKRKEKEEEELIEKRVQEQAERLRREYVREQIKKYDWLQQKQAQDEILRKRLEELELKSDMLTKQEGQKKLQENIDIDKNPYSFSSNGGLPQKRSTPPYSSSFSASAVFPAGNGGLPLARTTFTKSPILETAPLLDSDKQNILSIKASELRQDFQDFNNVGALKLEPGVNLLSPQYNLRDNGINTSPLGNESKSAREYFEGYQPSSVVQTSPRIASRQDSCDSPNSHHYSLLTSQNNQRTSKRPSSPVIPALQTDMLLKKSTKAFDDKLLLLPNNGNDFREISPQTSVMKEEPVGSRNILTQLGEFRRKLAKEHQLLEQRLMHNNS